jgi:hypothetical protein
MSNSNVEPNYHPDGLRLYISPETTLTPVYDRIEAKSKQVSSQIATVKNRLKIIEREHELSQANALRLEWEIDGYKARLELLLDHNGTLELMTPVALETEIKTPSNP